MSGLCHIFTSGIPYVLENYGSFENKGELTKNFRRTCGFWALRGCVSLCGWLVGWRESVQKRKFRDKDHFSDNVELSSKKL